MGGVRLVGACAGPPHLSDEPLQAMAPLDLRCNSKEETLKDEFERDDESTKSSPRTAKPKQKVKCPVNCDCHVSILHGNDVYPSGSASVVHLSPLHNNDNI